MQSSQLTLSSQGICGRIMRKHLIQCRKRSDHHVPRSDSSSENGGNMTRTSSLIRKREEPIHYATSQPIASEGLAYENINIIHCRARCYCIAKDIVLHGQRQHDDGRSCCALEYGSSHTWLEVLEKSIIANAELVLVRLAKTWIDTVCQHNERQLLIAMTLSRFSLSPVSIDWNSLGRENSMCRETWT